MKKLSTIPSNVGITQVNSKFKFSNTKLLTSISNLNKNTTESLKNVVKIVDSEEDAARTKQVFNPSVIETSIKNLSNKPKLPETVQIRQNSSLNLPPVAFSPISPPRLPPTNLSGARTTSLAGILPPVGVGGSSLTPTTSISIFSGIYDLEKSIFKSGTFLNASNQIDEIVVGRKPSIEESCRIIAVIEDSIKNGYPKSNIVFFKKFNSSRGYATKYTIYRKDLFREFFFRKLAVLDPSSIRTPANYDIFLQDIGYTPSETFIIQDFLIRNDAVYVYKIETEWVLSATPTNLSTGSLSRFVDVDFVSPDLRTELSSLLTGSSFSTSTIGRIGRL